MPKHDPQYDQFTNQQKADGHSAQLAAIAFTRAILRGHQGVADFIAGQYEAKAGGAKTFTTGLATLVLTVGRSYVDTDGEVDQLLNTLAEANHMSADVNRSIAQLDQEGTE